MICSEKISEANCKNKILRNFVSEFLENTCFFYQPTMRHQWFDTGPHIVAQHIWRAELQAIHKRETGQDVTRHALSRRLVSFLHRSLRARQERSHAQCELLQINLRQSVATLEHTEVQEGGSTDLPSLRGGRLTRTPAS